jgi:fructose-specific phosphotransferase system IIA component
MEGNARMHTADLFLPECMTMDLQASDKWQAIRELSQLLLQAGRISSVETFEQAVIEREKQVSTGVGFGIGIPHGRSAAVLKSSIAFGRSRQGLPFRSIDDKPVQLVFLLAVPESMDDREYLGALSRLARLMVHEDFRSRLMQAETVQDVLQVLHGVREQEAAS